MKTSTSQIPTQVLTQVKKTLLEKKCEDLLFLDLREVNSYLSFFAIATVKTETQGRSVAKELEKILKQLKLVVQKNTNQSIQKDGGNWILLDYGDVCVHLMTKETRLHYALERLWGDAKEIAL